MFPLDVSWVYVACYARFPDIANIVCFRAKQYGFFFSFLVFVSALSLSTSLYSFIRQLHILRITRSIASLSRRSPDGR